MFYKPSTILFLTKPKVRLSFKEGGDITALLYITY